MWTNSVKPFSYIAVVAKYLEPVRVIILDKPIVNSLTAQSKLLAMFVSVSVDVIYSKKFIPVLTATGAFTTIML